MVHVMLNCEERSVIIYLADCQEHNVMFGSCFWLRQSGALEKDGIRFGYE